MGDAELYRLIAERLRKRANASLRATEAEGYHQVADGWEQLADEADERTGRPRDSSGANPPESSEG
jgi:hypothetical protein